MINEKHVRHLKFLLDTLVEETVSAQIALEQDQMSPEVLRDLFAALDFAEHRVSGIMYEAGIGVDGAYTEDE